MANQLYDAVRKLVMHCNELGLGMLVEDPHNSLYWETTFAKQYIQCIAIFFLWIHFHYGAHEGCVTN